MAAATPPCGAEKPEGRADVMRHKLWAVLSRLLARLGLVLPGKDFVLYAAGRVGGQLDVLVRAVGVYRLDQADGPNGNEILYVDACVLKPAGNVDDQAEVALNEDLTGFLLPRVQAGQDFRFLLPA